MIRSSLLWRLYAVTGLVIMTTVVSDDRTRRIARALPKLSEYPGARESSRPVSSPRREAAAITDRARSRDLHGFPRRRRRCGLSISGGRDARPAPGGDRAPSSSRRISSTVPKSSPHMLHDRASRPEGRRGARFDQRRGADRARRGPGASCLGRVARQLEAVSAAARHRTARRRGRGHRRARHRALFACASPEAWRPAEAAAAPGESDTRHNLRSCARRDRRLARALAAMGDSSACGCGPRRRERNRVLAIL